MGAGWQGGHGGSCRGTRARGAQHPCPGEWRNPEGEVQDAGVGEGRWGKAPDEGQEQMPARGGGRRVGVKWGTGPPRDWVLCSRPREHWQTSTPGDENRAGRVEGSALSKSHPRGWRRKASES